VDLGQPDIVVQIGREPARVDIMTSSDGGTFDEVWGARLVVALDGLDVPILAKHHLLANKRATARPQDVADAERLEASDPGQGNPNP
jgi:hypothetical protein